MILMLHRKMVGRTIAIASVFALAAWLAPAAGATPSAHGHVVHITKPGLHANANQSNNWFGYNQGTQERGTKFHSIAGDWTVPSARQHTKGQSESSSTWIGIGGGCTDAKCTMSDNTLIQTGTEQDVSASGKPSYSAWWEIIPAPSSTITNMTVRSGDHMRASITEAPKGSEVWHISLQDLTRHETLQKDRPVHLDLRHRGVDRGDADRDRHQRGPRRPADSLAHAVRPREGERRLGSAQGGGADSADDHQRPGHRHPVGS